MLLAAAAAAAPERPRKFSSVPLGVAVELEKSPRPGAQEKVFTQLRESGAAVFGVEVSWPEAEPSPGQYRIEDAVRAARIFRQSGAIVHLDIPLVSGREKLVPADLAGLAFDDPKLSLRLGHLLDALEPALRDCFTLSLGKAADVYFSDKPEELKAYRRLFDGAVAFLKQKAPALQVGVTTLSPTESPAPVVAAVLHQHSPVLFYIYAPFESDKSFVHRPPNAIERDWRRLLLRAGGRPIAFPEVSYSSSSENGSSPEMQADFVRRLRGLAASTDAHRLLFARYATLRDEPPPQTKGLTPEVIRRDAFFGNRGLQRVDGTPKPAWKEFVAGH